MFRFIAGLGAGGEYGIGMAIVAEAWPKNKQGRAYSYVSVGAQYGVILAALLSAIILFEKREIYPFCIIEKI